MSITPPQSPFQECINSDVDDHFDNQFADIGPSVENDDTEISLVGPLFRCEINQLACGVSQSESLERMKNPCKTTGRFPPITEDLYGFTFDPSTALIDHMDELFLLTKQTISTIQLSAEKFSHHEKGFERRQSVSTFLEYINVFIRHQVPVPDVTTFTHQLAYQIHYLLLYLGSVAELTTQILATSSDKNASNLFHLHLDTYWGVLRILHTLQICYKDHVQHRVLCTSPISGVADTPLFDQSCCYVLWELIVLASSRFQRVSSVEKLRDSPYVCGCVGELWTLVSGLLNHRQSYVAGQSFWGLMYDLVNQLLSPIDHIQDTQEQDSTVISLPPPLNIKHHADFCFWLLDHLTKLFTQSAHGTTETTESFSLLKLLLKHSLSSVAIDEGRLRSQLTHTLHISSRWLPSTDVLLALWDYFYKKLNQNFTVAAFGVKGLQSISVGVYTFLGECRKRCDTPLQAYDSESSFGLFLRLVGLTLKRIIRPDDNHEWRQIKGRFYSKFHPRKMHDLTEIGLHNFTSLFLGLCLSADLPDVSNKLLDFYDMLPETTLDVGRRVVVMKGQLAIAAICESRGVDAACVTSRLTRSFDAVCREYVQTGSRDQRSVWTLVSYYVGGVRELAEKCGHLGVVHRLIGSGFATLLPACSPSHMTVVLATIDVVITKLRMALTRDTTQLGNKSDLKCLSDTLWQQIYPFITSHSRTNTPPRALSDIAAMFCLVSLKLQPPTVSGRSENFLSCFQYFAMKEDVSVDVTCRFLGNVLHIVLHPLQSQLPHYQRELVKAWLRCCLLVQGSSPDLQAINRSMLRVPLVSDTLSLSGLDPSLHSSVYTFIKALGLVFRNTDGLMNKIAYRDQTCVYFTDLTKSSMSALRATPAPEVVSSIYGLISRIIKHCSPIVYVKSKPTCELPPMLDCLILPPNLFNPDKPVSPLILTALRDNALLIIQGLSELPYTKDAYINRRLKDFITILTNHFSLKGNNQILCHPLMVFLNRNPCQELIDFILQVLADLLRTVRPAAFNQSPEIQGLMAEMISLSSVTSNIREKFKQVLLGIGDQRKK